MNQMPHDERKRFTMNNMRRYESEPIGTNQTDMTQIQHNQNVLQLKQVYTRNTCIYEQNVM